jgi:fibronectin type 3 domain-containing protein
MRSLSRSAATSFRRLLVLASVAAVCALGLVQSAAFAAGTPPPQPLNLNDQSNANNSITLTWDPTPGATSYHLYRGTSSGGEGTTPIVTTTGTSYTDSGLAVNTGYFYEVTAVNSAGESPRSAEDPSHTTPPTPTGGNTPGVASGNSLIFYGKDALLGGFQWFEALTGWFPQVLGSSGANSPGHVAVDMAYAPTATLTFHDVVVPTSGLYTVNWRYAFASGLFPGVTNRQMGLMVNGTVITTTERFPITGGFETYQDSTIQVHLNAGKNSVQMFAVDDHGVSRVDEMTITPATASVPSGPTNLTSTSGSGFVTLHWTASSGGPTSYSIYRGTKSDGEATTPVATVSGTTTTFTDTGLTNASSYYYMVAANNAAGVSPDSNEIIATPGVTLPSGTNLALNQPTYASSIQGAGYPATAATDDSFNTRWSSAASDPQWLLVDLGATHTISQVVLAWESAYAKAFQIQVSSDAVNWTTIYSTTTGPAARRRSRSAAPAATSGCTARNGRPATGIRCGSSRCSAPDPGLPCGAPSAGTGGHTVDILPAVNDGDSHEELA